MTSLKEKYLLYRICNRGDVKAFGEVYDLYIKRIFRFVYFKVPTKQEAEDITSEVFLRAWKYLQENRVEYIRAFLYQIARNAVMDFYREQAKMDITRDEGVLENIEDDNDLVGTIELKADLAEVLEALKLLKDEYQEVVIMKYLDDMSTKEIASVLRKKPGSVRVQIHRALNALREQLEDQKQK